MINLKKSINLTKKEVAPTPAYKINLKKGIDLFKYTAPVPAPAYKIVLTKGIDLYKYS